MFRMMIGLWFAILGISMLGVFALMEIKEVRGEGEALLIVLAALIATIIGFINVGYRIGKER